VNWTWIDSQLPTIWQEFGQHVWLSVVPVVIGLVISIPIGAVAHRYGWLRPPLVTIAGLIYTIPSLALFVVLPGLLGTKILDPINVVVALTLYTVALLVRTVADALDTVPDDVRQAALAMGYRPVKRLLAVDLPISVPVIGAGVRVATVSNVSLVAVAALIGVPQLGSLFTQGFQDDFATPIIVGIIGCLVLALVLDLLIVLAVRLLTPWQRAGGRRTRRSADPLLESTG
jgi:osmoprotectant transport system permease protein